MAKQEQKDETKLSLKVLTCKYDKLKPKERLNNITVLGAQVGYSPFCVVYSHTIV